MLTKIKEYLHTHPQANFHTIGGLSFLFLMVLGISFGLIANYTNTAIRPQAADMQSPNSPPYVATPTPTPILTITKIPDISLTPVVPSQFITPTLTQVPTSVPTPTPVPPSCTGIAIQYNPLYLNQSFNTLYINGVKNATSVLVSSYDMANPAGGGTYSNATDKGGGQWAINIATSQFLFHAVYPQTIVVNVVVKNAATSVTCGKGSYSIINPNLALNKTVTTSSGSYTSQNAAMVDGNASTYWTIGKVPQWTEVNLGAAYTVSRVRLRTGPGMSGNVRVSIRNGAYQEVYYSGNTGVNMGPNQYYDFTFPATAMQNVRIYNPIGTSTNLSVQWAEIEVYVK